MTNLAFRRPVEQSVPAPQHLRRGLSAVLSAVLLLTLSGCAFGLHGLAFRTDTRLRLLSPVARSHVRLPLTISWTIHDFTVVGPGAGPVQGDRAGYFAVFLDGSPVPHDQSLRYVARGDRTCRAVDGCPDAAYLAAHGVYTTTSTSLLISQLPRPAVTNGHEHHQVTVVLLDPSGHRIGESFYRVDFILDRKALS